MWFNKLIFKLLSIFVLCLLIGCSNPNEGKFTDPRDGRIYKTIKIGNQIWMSENLNYDIGEGCYCFDNVKMNCDKYGKSYTWEAAKKAIPVGWHLPSKEELEILLKHFGSDTTAFKQMIITGESGFNALCGDSSYISFDSFNANFWSKTENNLFNDMAFGCTVDFRQKSASVKNGLSKDHGYSVRCIKDN